MSAEPYAGPAFPVVFEHSDGQVVSEQFGMDLRDFFAAKALQKVIAFDCNRGSVGTPDEAARLAYQYADAMLRAREAS